MSKNRFIVPIGEPLALKSDLVEYLATLNGDSYREILALGLKDVDAAVLDDMADDEPVGSIGHMRITGPITRYSQGPCSRMFGATSIDLLTDQLTSLATNPDVKSIVMEIDSPGGQASGIADFSDFVRSVSKSKPVIAFVSDTGASAAYWIAVASTHLMVSQTASVGSIGVYAAITDDSKAMENAGYKEITFVSSQSPKKRPDYTSDDGRAQIQAQIDALAGVFVDSVAKFRGVDSKLVLSDFGQGDVVFATDAVNRGMADSIGTIEDAFKMASDMIQYKPVTATSVQSFSVPVAKAGISTNNGGNTKMTRAEILDQFPEAAAEIARLAASEERTRIQAIERLETEANMAVAGSIITTAKYTEGVQARDVALQILDAQRDTVAIVGAARTLDAAAIPDLTTVIPEQPSFQADAELIASIANRNKGGK